MKDIVVKNIVVFGIVEMPDGKIILVQERGNFPKPMWKLPGGRPNPNNGEHEQTPEYFLLREINDETGVIVKSLKDKDLIFEKELTGPTGIRYNFIVYVCRHYSGELNPGAEIEC